MTNSAIVTPFRTKNSHATRARAIGSREPRERNSGVDARIIAVSYETLRAISDGSLGRLEAESAVELKKLIRTRVADRLVERKRRGKNDSHRKWLAGHGLDHLLNHEYLVFKKDTSGRRPRWYAVVTDGGQQRLIDNCKSNHPSTRSIKRTYARKAG